MRVLGKPLTETAPGRLEWLRWVGPLRSNCLLRLSKTYKDETVKTTSANRRGKQQLANCMSLHVRKCIGVRWILSRGTLFFVFSVPLCLPPALSHPVLSHPAPTLSCPLYIQSPLFYWQTPALRGGNCKIFIVSGPAISCIAHWSAHKRSTAIDPLVFLINGLSLWETTGFRLPIRTLW